MRPCIFASVIRMVGTSPAIKRIFPIQIPFQGVVDDVFTGAGQFILVPDNPFVIIALPDRTAGVVADDVDAFGGLVFEISDNLSQCRIP